MPVDERSIRSTYEASPWYLSRIAGHRSAPPQHNSQPVAIPQTNQITTQPIRAFASAIDRQHNTNNQENSSRLCGTHDNDIHSGRGFVCDRQYWTCGDDMSTLKAHRPRRVTLSPCLPDGAGMTLFTYGFRGLDCLTICILIAIFVYPPYVLQATPLPSVIFSLFFWVGLECVTTEKADLIRTRI